MAEIFEVAVIGMGVMGSACTHALAKSGLKVLAIEQFSLGHSSGSSHGDTRIIRKAYFEDPQYVPLLNRSYILWGELQKSSQNELFVKSGIFYLGQKSSPLLTGIRKSSELYKIPLEDLAATSGEEVLRKYSFLNLFQHKNFSEKLFEPDAGFLKVASCMQAFHQGSRNAGAKILENEKVESWKEADSIFEVKTNKSQYLARKIVLTQGPWMKETLSNLGIKTRLLRKVLTWIKAPSASQTSQSSPCYLVDLGEKVFYGFPSVDGLEGDCIKVSEHSGGEEFNSPEQVDRNIFEHDRENILKLARSCIKMDQFEIKKQSTCIYTSTNDEHFIVDRHPTNAKIILVSPCSGHGFKFAPVIGETVKNLVCDNTFKVEKSILSMDRIK